MPAKTPPVTKKKPKKPETVDAYLATLPDAQRATLQTLRERIQTAAPKAVECISYGMPAFKLDARILLWFAAGKHHCALYPGAVVQSLRAELRGYETSKGTIRFEIGKPLSLALVRKIVKAKRAQRAKAER